MALSGLAIAGIILIVIGIIMAIIGIILLIVENTTTTSWYVWFLVLGGILLGIIGGVILAIALSEPTIKAIIPIPGCPIPQPICPVPQPICPIPQPTCPLIQPVIKPTCPYANYTAPQVFSPPVFTPMVKPQVPLVPSPIYSQRVEQLGDETFDPDPVTSVIDKPPTTLRRTVNGPYGPSGENIDVTGIHKIPGQRTYVTRDIPEHPVTSNITEF